MNTPLRHTLALLLTPTLSYAASPEVRGTWVTTTGITSPSSHVYNLAATTSSFQSLRNVGLNSIYLDVWRAGHTYYPSPTQQALINRDRSPDLAAGRDLLQESVIQAHRSGLAVIPWFQYGFATYFGSATSAAAPPIAKYMHDRGWLLKDAAGAYTNSSNSFSWMNPAVPEVRAFLIGIVTDAVRKYDLDGVQFDDRLAWPVQFGYDDTTRALYKSETGRDLPASYADSHFKSWRASKVTTFAQEMQAAVKTINPNAIVSSAPPVYPFSYDSYLANYPQWNQLGLFDEFIPQVYRRNATDFDTAWDGSGSTTTGGQRQFFGSRADDFRAGIAIDGSGWTAPYSPNGIAEEIAQTRNTPDVGGHVLWYSNGVLNLYKNELTALYNVAATGHAERPDRPANYRPPATVASLTATNRWTATPTTTGIYSIIVFNGTTWTIFDTRHLPAGTPATFPISGAQKVELIADHRPASLFDTTSWNSDASGPATTPANWSFNQLPANTALKFGYVITAPRTLTLDAPLTATSLTFDNANRYTLAGPATLTVTSSISLLTGSHTLAAPLSTPSPISLSLPTGTSLDISSNSLLLSTPAPTLRAHLLAGRLTSSTPDPSDLHSLAYVPVGNALLLQLTLTGDANLDGSLNSDDYALLDRGFATNGQHWYQGDFNYDGAVTSADYLLIDRTYLLLQTQGFESLIPTFLALRAAQFGPDYVSQLLTSIPEPSPLLLLTSAFCLLPSRFRPRQSPSGITTQRIT